jgi:DnaJ-domain-containing protein 1
MHVKTSWKELYLWALIESDKEKLTGLVQAIESALASRAQELLNSSDHHEERSEMAAANAALLSMKTNKLGWPPVSARDGLRVRRDSMQGKARERWQELCEQAANEQDPAKMLQIVEEINRLLAVKYDRLSRQDGAPPRTSKDSI